MTRERDDSNSRVRILVIGDAAVPTGFARAIEGIFRGLCDKYEVHHLGVSYDGDPHDYAWKIYRAAIGGDVWGARRIIPLCESVQPHLIFILNDIWVLQEYMQVLSGMENLPPVILYCPVDGGPIDPENVEPLRGCSRFVVYTEFARAQVEAAVVAQRKAEPDFNFPTVEIIPHGVDTNIFFPLDGGAISERGRPFGRLEARRLIFPEAKDRDERFIVLNANRNQSRKRIDITIRGFALFAKGKPENVKLYLHMGVEDVGWNVLQLARRYGIENRLLLSSLSKEHPVASAEQLNLIYNACDVGINTSTAEGWGLVSFEHAATGAAQIVPRHSACQELWRDAAVMIEPAMALINEGISTEGWLVTPEGVAEALEKLYLDPQYLVEMSGKALRVAHRPEYRWETVSGQWDMLFQQTL